MGSMTQEECERFFKPFERKLRKAFNQADANYREKCSQFLHLPAMKNRVKANLRNVFILEAVREVFDGDDRVRFIESQGGDFVLFRVNDKEVLVRFKKLDRNRQSRNIRTGQVFDFRCQRTMEIPGIPHRLEHFEIGYVLDRFGQVAEISVVRPQRNGVSYHFNIHEVADNVVQLSLAPTGRSDKQKSVMKPSKGAKGRVTREKRSGEREDSQ